MVQLREFLFARLALGGRQCAVHEVGEVERAAADAEDLPVDHGERRSALGRCKEEVVRAIVPVADRVRRLGEHVEDLDDLLTELLAELDDLRRKRATEVLDERAPGLLIGLLGRGRTDRVVEGPHPVVVLQLGAFPPGGVELGQLGDGEVGLHRREAGDLVGDLGGREVLQQEDKVARAADVDIAVVEVRRDELDLAGDLFVEARLDLVEAEDLGDLSGSRPRARGTSR